MSAKPQDWLQGLLSGSYLPRLTSVETVVAVTLKGQSTANDSL